MFALLFSLLAKHNGVIRFVIDGKDQGKRTCEDIFTSIEREVQNYGKVKYSFTKIPTIEDFHYEEHGVIPEKQQLIIVVGVLNYLSDPQVYKLFQDCKAALQEHGEVVITCLGPSQDASFFSDFLGWATIRRSEQDIVLLAQAAGLMLRDKRIDDESSPAMVLAFSHPKPQVVSQ